LVGSQPFTFFNRHGDCPLFINRTLLLHPDRHRMA
jgi:hypothetical protein